MSRALQKLERFAAARLADPRGEALCEHVDRIDARALTTDLMVPEDFAVGARTPQWRHLSDEQRLALNHRTYFMMYFRIAGGSAG